MEGLRGVANIVAQPAGIEEDRLLDGAGVLMGRSEVAVLAQSGLEALPDFSGNPGLEADLFRALAGGKDLGLEVQAPMRKGAKGIGQFEVDEVLWSLGGYQFRLGGRAPAIGLGTQVLDLIESIRRVEECGYIGRKRGRGKAVDHAVALVAPGACTQRQGKNEDQPRDGWSCLVEAGDDGRSAHEASIGFKPKADRCNEAKMSTQPV